MGYYNVELIRSYQYETWIQATNEEEALNLAKLELDKMEILGAEMQEEEYYIN